MTTGAPGRFRLQPPLDDRAAGEATGLYHRVDTAILRAHFRTQRIEV